MRLLLKNLVVPSTSIRRSELVLAMLGMVCTLSVLITMYQDRPSSLVIARLDASFLPRKEVIHPHLPVRIPCYDLTPIISPTLGLD